MNEIQTSQVAVAADANKSTNTIKVPNSLTTDMKGRDYTVASSSANASTLHITSKEVTQAQIIVTPQPLKIDIDTPTDWPAVLAPFVLGAAAFYFTSSNQTQQIRSSTASYRNEWLKEVRAAAIEFTSVAFEYQLRKVSNPAFGADEDDEARALLTRMLKAQATMVLMLDVKQPYAKEINNLMHDVTLNIEQGGTNLLTAAQNLREFNNQTHLVLEKAWQDIRKDLGNKKGFFSRIRGRFRWVK
jgi:hypothetical protein